MISPGAWVGSEEGTWERLATGCASQSPGWQWRPHSWGQPCLLYSQQSAHVHPWFWAHAMVSWEPSPCHPLPACGVRSCAQTAPHGSESCRSSSSVISAFRESHGPEHPGARPRGTSWLLKTLPLCPGQSQTRTDKDMPGASSLGWAAAPGWLPHLRLGWQAQLSATRRTLQESQQTEGLSPGGRGDDTILTPRSRTLQPGPPGGGQWRSEEAGLTSLRRPGQSHPANPGPRLAPPADAASREPGATGGACTSSSEVETMFAVDVCRLMCGKR